MKIILIGGDKRQIKIKQNLEDAGHTVLHIINSTDLKYDFKDYQTVIFPLPTSRDGIFVNNSLSEDKIKISSITEKIDGQKILCGNFCFPDNNYFDYGKDESTAILNAVPTAEGAVATAILNTPFTLWKSRCLVVGYGKIGKMLSSLLKSFSADVTVSARKQVDFAFIEAHGLKCIKTADIHKTAHEYDIIFNTIPTEVITEETLKKCKKDCLIVELASSPYGVDFYLAEKYGIRVISAQGLPGKTAPDTAADILTNVILNNLSD